ncbi:MAG: RNA methyltransferase [Gammaproteobacteria bacterium]|nr:RNA methyltransferase [Gammaproteobacteria bacterium]
MQSSNIRIVLVETSHPGNIGGVARAMKNMGLSELSLVKPKVFPSGEATARASGADDVLHNALVVDTLEQALADCTMVVGTTARFRRLQFDVMNPRECAAKLAEASATEKVALVFGREDSGLSNDELNCCHALVHIPTNPDFQSLNLAAAVQILAYELAIAGGQTEMPTASERVTTDDIPATIEEMEGFYQHMHDVLLDIGFLKGQYQQLLRRLRRLFNRAAMTRTEVNILRGIFQAASGRKYQWMKDQGLTNDRDEPTK